MEGSSVGGLLYENFCLLRNPNQVRPTRFQGVSTKLNIFNMTNYKQVMVKKSHFVKVDPNDKKVMKQRSPVCKVLRPPTVTSKDHFKNLGFLGGCNTLMYVSHKKAKFPDKSLYALGRSWFKEVVTEKDKCASTEVHKKQKRHRSDDDEAKGYLKEFVEQAKAAKVLARMSRKKGKMVKKQALSTSTPRGKRKFPKIRSLNNILRAIDQESGN